MTEQRLAHGDRRDELDVDALSLSTRVDGRDGAVDRDHDGGNGDVAAGDAPVAVEGQVAALALSSSSSCR